MSSPFEDLVLFHYWRSSSSWRVRWALLYKNIPCSLVAVNLLKGEQKTDQHVLKNPSGQVPVLKIKTQTGKGVFLSESMAILEWINESDTQGPSLLPHAPLERAQVRELCEIINSGTQPIQNLKVQRFHSTDPNEQEKWAAHWIHSGLESFEKACSKTAGEFCFGDSISFADLFLIPQCYNAERFGLKLDQFPTVKKINTRALQMKSCMDSAPAAHEPKA